MSDLDAPLVLPAPSPRQKKVLRLWKRIKQLQGMKVGLENAVAGDELRVELNKEIKSNVRGSLQVEVVVREILQRVAGMSEASGAATSLCEQPVSEEHHRRQPRFDRRSAHFGTTIRTPQAGQGLRQAVRWDVVR